MNNACQLRVHISWRTFVVFGLFMMMASYHKNHRIYIIWYYIMNHLAGVGPSMHMVISLIISIWHTAIKMVKGGFVPVRPQVTVCFSVSRFSTCKSESNNGFDFTLDSVDVRQSWKWLLSHWYHGRHLADGIFRCIFVNQKRYIFIHVSLGRVS